MGVLFNRRRYMGALKQAKTLFEMYDQYFDGTVNSVVDTGLKLWDGTHNRWKMEVEYDAITKQYTNNITLFAVRPDVTPCSGIRVRKDRRAFDKNSDFTLTVGEACTVISNPGEFGFDTSSYGSHLYIGNTNSVNTLTLIRDGQYLYCDYNGQLATLKITDPKTNNLNLLIGCDYKGANNETQRYYTGTVQKFVISELGDIPFDEIEYLESTGTQYIQLDIPITNGLLMEYEVSYSNGNTTTVISTIGNIAERACINYYNQYRVCVWRGSNANYIGVNPQYNVFYTVSHDFRGSSDTVVWNSSEILNREISTPLTSQGVVIFADLTRAPSKGKAKWLRITSPNDDLLYDLIPVRIGTTGYMYDKVSGQLFGNAGTGSFILGSDKT